MKFSENWLRTFVNPSLSTNELADLLTFGGIEPVETLLERAGTMPLPPYIASKRETARVYAEAFADLPGITLLPHAPWAESIDWMFTIRVDADAFGMDSRALLRRLEAEKIQSRPLWQPMHRSLAHAGAEAVGGEVADALCRECLSLPCSVAITAAERERVIRVIKSAQRGVEKTCLSS